MESKYQFAKNLIKEVGLFLKEAMTKEIAVEEKTAPDDLVTNLDKLCQKKILSAISKSYPEDCFLAEENQVTTAFNQGKVWIIDPIDGTVNFIAQKEQFAIMIAYYEDGIGQFGLIYDPVMDLLYHGGGVFSVYCNDKLLTTYQEQALDRSLVGVNAHMLLNNSYQIREFTQKTLGIRIYGGAGVSMAQVMTQKLIAYFSWLSPWDYAAAAVLGEKLGYTLLTMDGRQPDFASRQMVMFIPKPLTNTILNLLDKKEA